MKVLVTGGAGFIGSHVVSQLLKSGHNVTVLDNLSTGFRGNIDGSCELVVGDIRDEKCVSDCMVSQDVVFHLAAFTSVEGSFSDPQTCIDVNINGTANILEKAVQFEVEKVVFSSSSAVYPEYPDDHKSEDGPVDPKSPYADSKWRGEHLVRKFNSEYQIKAVSLRYFNVYGPLQHPESSYAAVIPIFISRAQLGKSLTIYGNGLQTRDFVYVEDVARANLLALNMPGYSVFNVGTSTATSIIELARMIIHMEGAHSGYEFSVPRSGDLLSSTADISTISQTLGWVSQWDLQSGLRQTCDWIKSIGLVE